MATGDQSIIDRRARRGVYFLAMGAGAFFSYFNELNGWVQAPDYPRLGDFLFDRIDPYIHSYLPTIVLSLGVLFLVAAGYNFYRLVKAGSSEGSAA